MKFLRFCDKQGNTFFGEDLGDKIRALSTNFLDEYSPTNDFFSHDEITLLPPVVPSKIIAVGLNYYNHIKEFGDREVPKNPTLFSKMPHTVIAANEAIIKHDFAGRVDFEGELAIIISKKCKNAAAENAADYIFGATCLNDVTARDLQASDGQWHRGKNLETFCPIGPCIATDIDFDNLSITSRLNGNIRQFSNTNMMIFSPAKLVEFVSQAFPLEKGDIITTGTPEGVGEMLRGDIIEIEIENIGILRNIVK